MSSITNTSDQVSTLIRPFAPDDFRREKKLAPVLQRNTSRYDSLRSPQHLHSSQSSSNREATRLAIITARRSSLHESQIQADTPINVKNQNHKAMQPSSSSTSLKDLQEEAERDWQSLRNRRQSLGLLPSRISASLAKSAIKSRAESTYDLTQRPVGTQQNQIISMERSISLPCGVVLPSGCIDYEKSRPPSPQTDCKERYTAPSNDTTYHTENRIGTTIQLGQYEPSSDFINRASSKISASSSKASSGCDSLKALLQDGNNDARLQWIPESQSKRTMTVRQITPAKGMNMDGQRLVSALKSTPSIRQLETRNTLTTEEKMEQLKKSQKLDTMLGGEWRKRSDVHGGGSSSVVAPQVVSDAKRISLLRRQSDPQYLYSSWPDAVEENNSVDSITNTHEEKRGRACEKGAKSARWRSIHLHRSRSSLGFRHGAVSSASTIEYPVSPTVPPLDIHPKAAALLGLCVVPELSNVGILGNSAHQRTVTDGSVEILREYSSSIYESDSLDPLRKEIELTHGHRNASDYLDKNAFDADYTTSTHRTERRRRVRKISRWLGAVVPPHLILPNPEVNFLTQGPSSASGYNLDDAPPSPFADYMSGSPIVRSGSEVLLGTSGSAAGPLLKARAAVQARLVKRASSNTRLVQNDTDSSTGILSEKDRVMNVKRSHKLTSVFGQAPPQDLLQAGTIHPNAQRKSRITRSASESPKKRTQQFRSISPSTHNTELLFQPIDSSDNEDASSDSAQCVTHQQYRASIESLEYLVKKNSPLLKELVTAFAEEENKAKRRKHDMEDSGDMTLGDETTLPASFNSTDRNELLLNDINDRSRELRIRRHQKLGRWFGEPLLPSKREDSINDENIFQRAVDSTTCTATAWSAIPQSSSRMAPRSAGSAQRPHSLHHQRAFKSILNSLEGEVKDDDALDDEEKQQLQYRLQRLQCIDPHPLQVPLA